MGEQNSLSFQERVTLMRESKDEGSLRPGEFVKRRIGAKARRLAIVGGVGVGIIAAGANVAASFDRHTSLTSEVDFDEAESRTLVSVIDFDDTAKLQTAEVTFNQALTVNNIEFKIDSPIVDTIPNPEVDLALTGQGYAQIEVPVAALDQEIDAVANKVNITVDVAQIEQTIGWDEGKTRVYNDGDTEGNLNDISASLLDLVGVDGFKDTVQKITKEAEAFVRQKGLNDFNDSCGEQLNELGEQSIVDGVMKLATAVDAEDTIGTVKLSGEIDWAALNEKIEVNPELIPSTGGIKKDSKSCNVSLVEED